MAAQIAFVKFDDGIHVRTIENPTNVSYNQHTGLWEITYHDPKRRGPNGGAIRVVAKVKNLLHIEELP